MSFMVVGTADKTRAHIFQAWVDKGYSAATLIHPSMIILSRTTIERGFRILAGTIIQPEVSLMDNVNVNTAAVIERDCVIGASAVISPAACLCGNVTLEGGAFNVFHARAYEWQPFSYSSGNL